MEILIALIITAAPAAYLVWDRHFRVFPLSYFGIENVQRAAKWESDEWRERIFSRGGMRRSEWQSVITRQAEPFRDELRRRNL
ncbi:TPA: hypothetical protein MH390_25545 [Klebsiella pneumoniae]|nr:MULTISPECIES: hypothetical protein [Enterobacteriaceae]OQR47499.1 hypothetical protein BI322_02780 [Klebsiella oxytoca]QCD13906.1 hypothetical protein E7729_25475 [Enterobacter cloacae]HBS0596177.1 hypothetical protein [Klebsiella quasipneumoniae subsp. quasipneumoniae]HCM2947730.1 hypothetical protein [Klebsiella quasipneumoniae subsp. similipneumoniae]HEE9994494.1 hypothetical protein [Citrobacter braakii]